MPRWLDCCRAKKSSKQSIQEQTPVKEPEKDPTVDNNVIKEVTAGDVRSMFTVSLDKGDSEIGSEVRLAWDHEAQGVIDKFKENVSGLKIIDAANDLNLLREMTRTGNRTAGEAVDQFSLDERYNNVDHKKMHIENGLDGVENYQISETDSLVFNLEYPPDCSVCIEISFEGNVIDVRVTIKQYPISIFHCAAFVNETDLHKEFIHLLEIAEDIHSFGPGHNLSRYVVKVPAPLVPTTEIMVERFAADLFQTDDGVLVMVDQDVVPDENGMYKGVQLPPVPKGVKRVSTKEVFAAMKPHGHDSVDAVLHTTMDLGFPRWMLPNRVIRWVVEAVSRKCYEISLKKATEFESSEHARRIREGPNKELYQTIQMSVDARMASIHRPPALIKIESLEEILELLHDKKKIDTTLSVVTHKKGKVRHWQSKSIATSKTHTRILQSMEREESDPEQSLFSKYRDQPNTSFVGSCAQL